PLHAERFRHRHHQRVPLCRADHGEADTSIAARRLDHGLARLEGPLPLSILDDAEREAVFHRAEWIECFDLDVEIDARGREAIDLDRRRVADGSEDARESTHECRGLRATAQREAALGDIDVSWLTNPWTV